MLDPARPHAGIELDIIDIPGFSPDSGSAEKPASPSGIVDTENFLKAILQKTFANSSFLSFSSQIHDVNKILKMKYSSASDVADVIIRDVALTSKLLKLVNSSFYGQFSIRASKSKGVGTISESMIILGTEEIKLAAAGLKIYELMQDVAGRDILKKMALKSMQRSILARQISRDKGIKESEAIQISAMLYQFGEYLVALFSPEVYIKIEVVMDEKKLDRNQASRKVIGISYGELGRFVASKWHLPDNIIEMMKPVTNRNAARINLNSLDLQKVICAFCDELCGVDFPGRNNTAGKQILSISSKYEKSLDISAAQSVELLKMSWDKITMHAEILKGSGSE